MIYRLLLLLAFGLYAPCVSAKPKVVAVQYPLAFVAQSLAGDDFKVTNLTPAGVEPHDYRPGLRSLAQTSRADLFLYNSPSTEPWANRFSREVTQQGGTVFDAQSLFEPGGSNNFDPHWWLDPLMMLRYSEKLAALMIQAAPQAERNIKGRLHSLERQLIELDLAYLSGLKGCKHQKMVVGHDAYRYLSNRYHIESFALQGLTSESKPSLAHMAAAIKWIKKNRLKTVFVEPLTNPGLSETIAKEVAIQTLELNPLGNVSLLEVEQKKDYFSLMYQNLSQLTIGLECPAIH